MAWRVFAATATGASHLDAGLPCQDACAYELEGEVLCAVVCDGAGSVSVSDEGAQWVAGRMAHELRELVRAGHAPHEHPEPLVRAMLLELIDRVRNELDAKAHASGHVLNDYASTLVGAVCNAECGWLFHIGDGVAVAEPSTEEPPLVSRPENGEYANETYFVTGADWASHLRLLPIERPLRLLALMSDGAAAFAMARGNTGLYRPFIEPVERYLAGVTEAAGQQALEATLADPRTHPITGDDKALLIALRC
jgi:hypothetical protein